MIYAYRMKWIHIFVPLPQRTAFFWLCTPLIAANTVLYIGAIIANYIVVIPLEALCKPWLDGRYLVNRQAADTAVISFNLVCDLLILILPQRVIWKLHLHRRRKIGLSILFGLGMLTCICAGGRVYTTATLNWKYDTIHDVPEVILWGVGESTFAMMVFCVPAVPRIFSGKEPSLVSRINKSLRSWSRLVYGSSRTGSQTSNLSQQVCPPASTMGSYGKMMEGDSEIALAGLGADSRQVQRPHRTTAESRIIKTTEVFTTEDSVSENARTAARHQAKSQQHPWMTGRS
ncbi:proteinrelated to integral membrane protein PTH11 [Metarhizium guizhouense ARSEF 977]|uniref:Proteinrelated to integral membrane protein PTH11 n=1 Tax=Metarhizium guizhouense (strain ARSEF 977) TaxID=1276136 RepID=A0A0B4HQQ0_METGA|nr:proteinrelated to integral membrane protein PTH11 [Metarhizium guizhouense ARSEF 977]